MSKNGSSRTKVALFFFALSSCVRCAPIRTQHRLTSRSTLASPHLERRGVSSFPRACLCCILFLSLHTLAAAKRAKRKKAAETGGGNGEKQKISQEKKCELKKGRDGAASLHGSGTVDNGGEYCALRISSCTGSPTEMHSYVNIS